MNNRDYLANRLLIAVPAMEDPHFARGVAFLCQHNEEGALGLLINRVSEYRLGDVLQQMNLPTEDLAIAERPVFVGGPVHQERGFVLHTASEAYESSFQVADDLWLTTSRDVLAAVAAGRGPRESLVALGYSGWGASQLEAELRENVWLCCPADRDILFQVPVDGRWDAAARRLGVDLSRLAAYVGHA